MQREYAEGNGAARDRTRINEQVGDARGALANRAYDVVGRIASGQNVHINGSGYNADVHAAFDLAIHEAKDPYLRDFLERQNALYGPESDCRRLNESVREGQARVDRMAANEAVARHIPIRDWQSVERGSGYNPSIPSAIQAALAESKPGTPLHEALTVMQQQYVEGSEGSTNRAKINGQIGDAHVDIANRAYEEVAKIAQDVPINRGVNAHEYNENVHAAFDLAITEVKDPVLRDFLQRQQALYQPGSDCSDFNKAVQEGRERVRRTGVGPGTDGEAALSSPSEVPQRTVSQDGVINLEHNAAVPARLRPEELRELSRLREDLAERLKDAETANQTERAAELRESLRVLSVLDTPAGEAELARRLPKNAESLARSARGAAGSIGALLLIIAAARQAQGALEHDTTNLPQPKPRRD
jgi:ribosome-associated translation inhibitor RaiA